AVPAAAATSTARARFAGAPSEVRQPRLVVDASTGYGRLAWESVIAGTARDRQTPSRLHVMVDARSGAVLGSWGELETVPGAGRSLYRGPVQIDTQRSGKTYRLSDPSHGGNTACDMGHRTSGACAVFTDADNTWGTGDNTDPQTAAVDAYYGAARTFD